MDTDTDGQAPAYPLSESLENLMHSLTEHPQFYSIAWPSIMLEYMGELEHDPDDTLAGLGFKYNASFQTQEALTIAFKLFEDFLTYVRYYADNMDQDIQQDPEAWEQHS